MKVKNSISLSSYSLRDATCYNGGNPRNAVAPLGVSGAGRSPKNHTFTQQRQIDVV